MGRLNGRPPCFLQWRLWPGWGPRLRFSSRGDAGKRRSTSPLPRSCSCAGEEISWGQRILGFETPDALREVNRQDEFTLHNVGQSLDVFKFLMFVGGGIGAAAYVANQRLRIQRFGADGEYLIIPPFFAASAFFLMFAYRLFRYIFFPNYQYTLTTYGEWIEFAFAYGFGVFAVLVYRHVTAARHATVDAPARVQTT